MVKAIRIGLLFCTASLIFSGSIARAEEPSSPDVVFVDIPGGSFRMGDERGDLWKSCRPVHDVTVSGFQMGDKEITNAQYCIFLNTLWKRKAIAYSDSIVRASKGKYKGKNLLNLTESPAGNRCRIRYSPAEGFQPIEGCGEWPVVFVTWYGAKAFAEQYGWDLPREAEWEYACRGGRQYVYGTCDGTIGPGVANSLGSDIRHPVDVGSYPSNPFGLYDMLGNVWEWCDDWYDGPYKLEPRNNPSGARKGIWRVMRGGGWSEYDDRFCRSAVRYYRSPNGKSIALGIRVVKR
jgi:formylglycine-generating enzyme required for sulfatase activity